MKKGEMFSTPARLVKLDRIYEVKLSAFVWSGESIWVKASTSESPGITRRFGSGRVSIPILK
jgi:hypothetical protein